MPWTRATPGDPGSGVRAPPSPTGFGADGICFDGAGALYVNTFTAAKLLRIPIGADGSAGAVTDIAVVKVAAPAPLPTLPWGDSSRLQVGEYVLAVGNPFQLNQTVTMGIVSAVGRSNVGVADYEDFIQTDAAINPGNSGGALINVRGELIGINTAVLAKSLGVEGIGFAIPVNLVRGVMSEILSKGRVVRGWIGIVPTD